MFRLFKKKTIEEQLKTKFKKYFIEYKYPEWEKEKGGVYSLPHSSIMFIHHDSKTFNVEHLKYILERIEKIKLTITNEAEISAIDDIIKDIYECIDNYNKEGTFTLCIVEFRLIFLCDKFLR